MSLSSDITNFATLFDFHSEMVSITDLVRHLRVLSMEVESIGIANGMACAAAADLLQRTCAFLPMDTPGSLIKQLRSIDSNTWGEME